MPTLDAGASGTFVIGGELRVNRLGFGAMRVTGPGIWGPPEDPAEARRVLRRVLELGINFIDTSDAYGPFISEELLGETLAPYPKGLVITTKGGMTRQGPQGWAPVGRPEYLRQCVLMSLRRLRLERFDLWQLHRIDRKVPQDEQFDVIAQMQREGLIRHVGLNAVGVEQIQEAGKYFKVATVQNLYNLVSRQAEEALDYCEKEGIGFIPWPPLSAGPLAMPGGALEAIARQREVPASAVAIAWLLQRSPVMLPIPGTGKVKHLEENTLGASLKLTEEEFRTLDAQGWEAWKAQ
ncbi:MAG: aldo/keto reductase [Myxococcaceae bacterium]|nr:aldo/keto reductase [Myxococcaceae bacterium]